MIALSFCAYIFFSSEVIPRPGTCPTMLKPPAGICTSDPDECMFDWDCEGQTKKCCSNNCFRECVEPALRSADRGKSATHSEELKGHFGKH